MPATREEILDRFNYRPPTAKQQAALTMVHILIMQCAEYLVDNLPDSRDRALALTSLEDTRMKMNKAVVFSDLG